MERYILKENVRGSSHEDICGDFDTLADAQDALREETKEAMSQFPSMYKDKAWFFAENTDNNVVAAYCLPKNASIAIRLVKGSKEYHMALEEQASSSFYIIKCPTNKRGRFYS